jgi:hypothetical protein
MNLHLAPVVPRCDFCFSPKPVTCFSVPDFVMEQGHPAFQIPQMISSGEWFACVDCKGLVEAGQWDDLVNRAVDKFCERHKLPSLIRPSIHAQVSKTYAFIRDHLRLSA